MKKVTLIARLLLGLVFFASSLFFFFGPPPPAQEGAIGEFFKGIVATTYFLPLLKGTELLCGFLLLWGRFVPLALTVLAPIILNIFLVHAFIAPEGLPIAIALIVFEVYLAFFSAEYSPTIKQLFRARVS